MTAYERVNDEPRVSDGYLRNFIDEAPNLVAMFDREMRYLAASRSWLDRLCNGDRGVIGRSHYEVIPDIPQHWKDMHRRALAGETLWDDEYGLQRAERRAPWVRREMRPWRDLHGEIGGIIISGQDLTNEVAAQRALHESEERLRLAISSSRMAMSDWDIKTGTLVWNDECYRLLGYQVGEVEPSIVAWMARIHPGDRESVETQMGRARREQKDYFNECRIVRPDGGVRWVRAHGRFFFDAAEPVRMIGLCEDVTEARQQAETQRVLVAELQHRTRNLMAVVQSIAHQTLSTGSADDFESRFNQRLEALSRVQSLLSRADDRPITLGGLLVMEFGALGFDTPGGKIELSGPEVRLRKSAVEMLALAIHELLTNAIKYGALASDTGRLSVTWCIEGTLHDQRLVLEWIERGIAPSAPAADSKRIGYGRTLIEEALPYSLAAETKFELGGDSLYCQISLPLA